MFCCSYKWQPARLPCACAAAGAPIHSNTKQMKRRMLKRSMDPWRDGRDESAKNITQGTDQKDGPGDDDRPREAPGRGRAQPQDSRSPRPECGSPGDLRGDRGKAPARRGRARWARSCRRAVPNMRRDEAGPRACPRTSLSRHRAEDQRGIPPPVFLEVGSERRRAGRIVCRVDQHGRPADVEVFQPRRATERASARREWRRRGQRRRRVRAPPAARPRPRRCAADARLRAPA